MQTDSITTLLRQQQEAAPGVGPTFEALHKFIDWATVEFFPHGLPPVQLRFERLRKRSAEYRPIDGNWHPHAIVLDPFKLRDGRHAAEAIAHELIHHYQVCNGMRVEDIERNAHDDEFEEFAYEFGLVIDRTTGLHKGYIGDVWDTVVHTFNAWAGLRLEEIEFPEGEEPKRRLHKYECEQCGFSFRTRRTNVAVYCAHGEQGLMGQLMEMVE